ncbi:neoverrucotoxin subunit alpha-like [Polymixia lowei]
MVKVRDAQSRFEAHEQDSLYKIILVLPLNLQGPLDLLQPGQPLHFAPGLWPVGRRYEQIPGAEPLLFQWFSGMSRFLERSRSWFSGVELLSAGLGSPHCRLETLSVDHGGAWRLKSGLRKYACELTPDPNTVNRNLSLSERNRKVTMVEEEQSYPDHPERFDRYNQVLCREGLTGRCYWEVERRGRVDIGMTYRGIRRGGMSDDCWLGMNNKSWCLTCYHNRYTAFHNKRRTDISLLSSGCNRVGVYLNWSAGSLSFYRVSSDTLTHIHTFHSTFTEPLYPGFGFAFGSGSSVSLCQIEEVEESPVSWRNTHTPT